MGLMNEYLSSDNRMKPNFVIIKNITINFITSYGAKSILLAYKEEEEKSSKSSKRREHARFNFTGEETENLRSGNCNINEFFKKTLNPIVNLLAENYLPRTTKHCKVRRCAFKTIRIFIR